MDAPIATSIADLCRQVRLTIKIDHNIPVVRYKRKTHLFVCKKEKSKKKKQILQLPEADAATGKHHKKNSLCVDVLAHFLPYRRKFTSWKMVCEFQFFFFFHFHFFFFGD
jgi:hypothetical protein